MRYLLKRFLIMITTFHDSCGPGHDEPKQGSAAADRAALPSRTGGWCWNEQAGERCIIRWRRHLGVRGGGAAVAGERLRQLGGDAVAPGGREAKEQQRAVEKRRRGAAALEGNGRVSLP